MDKALEAVAEQLLHRQRHDFLNHLQVIHAYLQVGKTERAMEYLTRAASDRTEFDTLLKELRQSGQTD